MATSEDFLKLDIRIYKLLTSYPKF